MKKVDTNEQAGDFANLVDLMSVYAEATTRMAALTQETQSGYIDLVDEHKGEYASLQETLMQAEAALEIVARRHPEWFAEAKSVKTPFGTVAFRAGSKLEVANEELTIVLIQQRIEAEEKETDVPGRERSRGLLRQTTSLNLEALEKLTDAELRELRIKRVTNDNFAVKAVKVDLGKAVKAAAAKEAA